MDAPTTEKTAMDTAKETEKKQTEVERIQNIIELRKTNLNPRKSAIAAHSKFEKVWDNVKTDVKTYRKYPEKPTFCPAYKT